MSVCLVGQCDRQRLWQVCFGRAGADLIFFLCSTVEKRVGIVQARADK